MKMFKKMKKGFTLVELIIVMVILGALAAIAIPKMGGSTDGAILASIKSDIRVAAVKANEEYSKTLTYANIDATKMAALVTPSPNNEITPSAASETGLTITVKRKAAPCSATTLAYDVATSTYTPELKDLTCK